jgi:sugar phosphate permease
MATQWFPEEQLALATTVGSLANPLGCILGMVLAPFFVNNTHHEKEDVNDLLVAHALLATIVSVPILIFYKERPEHFPSEAAKNTQNTKFNFMKDVRELVANPNYVWITMVFASLYGVYTSLGALINPLVQPYKFDTSDCSVIGATFITSGLVGSFFFGFLLDKYQKYLLVLRIVCFGTLFASLFVFLTLPSEQMIPFDINIAVMGFFILPIIPVGYSFSIELTFPVSEAMSNGIIMLFSQIVGTGVTYVSTNLIAQSPFSGLYLFAGMIAFSCFCSLMIKEDLRRINM